MIAELPADPDRPVRGWVALGTPCASVYVPVFPPDHVPPALAEPATWWRFAVLRDRVEKDPDTLVEVREVLGALEAELWERADHDARDPVARALCVTEAWEAVDAALVRLDV